MTKSAFLFPGQGSQKIGMLAELAAANPVVEQTFDEASEVLGYDSWTLVQSGEQEQINLTERTQPLLLTASIAIWRLWQQLGGAQPAVVAGHSLGEWSALVAAGTVEFAAAVEIVRQRGAAMQRAVPVGAGAMAAIIGLDDDKIIAACAAAEQGEVVSAVNFNAPGQVVITGAAAAVERAIAGCKESGAKRALPLPVSVPSHCALMHPAAEKLAAALQLVEIQNPSIPVINNVDVTAETDAARIKDALVRQLFSPVRWTEIVENMANTGIEFEVEMGPGKVLTGLTKRIVKTLDAAAVNDVASLDAVK